MVGFSTAQLMWLWVETVCTLGWEQKGYQILIKFIGLLLSQELQEESSLLFNHINHVSLVFRNLLTIPMPCLTIVCTSIFYHFLRFKLGERSHGFYQDCSQM